MKPIEKSNPPQIPQEKKKKNSMKKTAAIAALCFLFFIGGLWVPMAARSAGGSGDDSLRKFESIYDLLRHDWYYADGSEDIDSRLIEQAINGMTSLEEDPHTNYFSLEQAQAFSQSLSGSNVGIGIAFRQAEDGAMNVMDVFINSTADKVGIQPGDRIIRVQDKSTADTSSDDLISYIKSFEGKPLELEIERDGETLTKTVTPGHYDVTVSAKMKGKDGLVTLSSFSEQSGDDFAQALGRLKSQGAENLIIDLRNNTGGYLSAARQIASSLLPDNTPIFIEKMSDGTQKTTNTSDNYAQVDFNHIYILQNANTASASEVLIGALKDNMPDKITLVGTTTYGKGTEQISKPFADGTSIKYTVAEWLTPNGTSINKVGFAPDVEVTASEVQSVGYTPMTEDMPPIEPDTVSPNAAAVQIYLRALGYPATRSDTYFSPEASEALKQFQSDQGLEPTGVVDATTFDRLISEISACLTQGGDESDPVLNKALELSNE